MKRSLTYLWPVVILGVVVGAAAWTYRLVQSDARPGDASLAPTTAVVQPATITLGRDYYLWIRSIELAPKQPDGDDWDTDGSAPDISFHVSWQGNKLMESSKRSNTLIARWDLIAADMLDMVRSRKIEIEPAIQMPIARIDANSTLRIEVWDLDPMYSDSAGTVELKLDTLVAGVNTLVEPTAGIKRIEIQPVDVRTPLADLIELVTKR